MINPPEVWLLSSDDSDRFHSQKFSVMDWRKIVQDTAFDAVEAKCSASDKGYYNDPFIKRFLIKENAQPPHINYLYYLRTTFVSNSILSFHKEYGPNSQVVVLGCGYDTLFWRLFDLNIRFVRWFDLDLPEVIVRKLKLVNEPPALPTENYFARSIDLRSDFASGLIGEKFDKNLPTFFIDEFSMIYIDQSLVAPVLRFASTLDHSTMISIGLSNMKDDFGRVWIEAFRDNNTPLKGIENDTWESLFDTIGFASITCQTFENEAAKIQPDELSRIAQIEVQNKPDELSCLLRHYIVIRCIG